MRKLIIGVGVVFILLIGAFIIVPGLIPSDVYKQKIETQLSKELGRDVTISGDVRVRSFPLIRAKTNGIRIENYEGFSDRPFMSVEELEARIRLFPLLAKRVEIAGFNLIKPEISLERLADGRANWESLAENQEAETAPEPTTPFARDGRFNSLDPQIEAFNLIDGQITYSDAVSGKNYDASDIDGFLSLPGLSEPLEMDLSLTYQGERGEIDMTLDNVRAFLDGQEAPFKADVKTGFANISADGRFLASPEMDFQVALESEITDPEVIQNLSPKDITYLGLLNNLKAKGNFSQIAGLINANDTDIEANGDALSGRFTGTATLGETPVLNGETDFKITDFAALKPYLPEETPNLDMMRSLEGKASLSGKPNGFAAKSIEMDLTGAYFSAQFTGMADYSDAGITANGTFDTNVQNAANLAQAAEVESPYAALINTLNATGRLSYSPEVISVSNLEATASDGAVNGRYAGDISLAATPIANGQFSLDIPDFAKVAETLPTESPFSSSVKTVKASGDIRTEGETFILNNLEAALSEGLLNATFSGQGKYALNDSEALSLDGALTSEITDVRALAALNGTELSPDTESGNIYERFTINGDIAGVSDKLTLSNAEIGFDDIRGSGDISATLQEPRPLIEGNIALQGLDLRPYMASYSTQNPEGEIQPWSEAPLNLAPFQSVDANLEVTTQNVITDRLKLGQSEMSVTLYDGVLKADLPRMALYGGNGRMDLTFDASKSVPSLALTAGLNDLNGNSFLSAIAGFTKASGEAKTELSITSSGRSQAELMKGLNGQGGFGLFDGQIQGIDATKFLTGLDEALKSRSLPSGIGSSQVTKFKDLGGLFEINEGVVSLNEFTLAAIGVRAEGAGTIDLGQQTMDFRFRPRLTGEGANKLGSFGIPVRFAGEFGQASPGLDTEFLSKIVAERAKQEVRSRLEDEAQGSIGGILGGVLGGRKEPSDSAAKTETPKDTEQAEGSETDSQVDSETTSETEEKKEETEEEKSDIEKALGSLFGDR
jgi:uncharacterized protein involved in outer membrane biogenesis